jgi:hypothetical protein
VSTCLCRLVASLRLTAKSRAATATLKKGGVKTTTKYEAAERLVDSFSAIPTEWVKIVAKQTGAEFYGIMWGTMFLVNDPVDKRWIKSLLHPVTDEEDELSGYEEVGDTGIFAFDIDGQIVLGINGAGYDFYEHHWIPLYEALGYGWHETV